MSTNTARFYLLRISDKLSALGFPANSDSSGVTYYDSYDSSVFSQGKGGSHAASATFAHQQLLALTFIECKYVRALEPVARRALLGGAAGSLEAFAESVLLPYFTTLTDAKGGLAESGLLPSTRVVAQLKKGLSGKGTGDEQLASAVLATMERIADVAVGLSAAVDEDDASKLVPASRETRAALVSSSAIQSSNSTRDEGASKTSNGSASGPVTASESKVLERLMLNLIAVFGIPPPPKSEGGDGGSVYLQRLTRLAARCVFLGQRIALSPKDFSLDDAIKALQNVPLFGGSNTSGTLSPLEQYTQGLRLLLTLESELLQRFATMVVDEAQAYTAQCAFDPSGHRVGI